MPAEPHAIVVMGVAGSGKTSVARALADQCGFAFLDADDFHPPSARARMAAGVALTDVDREPWVESLARALRQHADDGRSTVLAFSGLRAQHRQRLRDSGVPMRFVFLHAPPHVIAKRWPTGATTSCRRACSSASSRRWSRPSGKPTWSRSTRTVRCRKSSRR